MRKVLPEVFYRIILNVLNRFFHEIFPFPCREFSSACNQQGKHGLKIMPEKTFVSLEWCCHVVCHFVDEVMQENKQCVTIR